MFKLKSNFIVNPFNNEDGKLEIVDLETNGVYTLNEISKLIFENINLGKSEILNIISNNYDINIDEIENEISIHIQNLISVFFVIDDDVDDHGTF